MDEQIERIMTLAGNNNRYQYFTLIVITFLWMNCNFISVIIPFIERGPLINYYDEEGNYHKEEILTNEICDLYKEQNKDLEIVERFKYSWISEYDIECEKMDKSLIGSFVFVGYAVGAVIFSIISKLFTHKTILIFCSIGFCITIFLNTLITSYSYFYCLLACLIFIGTFGNCLCYSSLVLAEEIVCSNKRSLFSSIINVGYALSGILYSLAFWLTNDWRIVFYICIAASLIALIVIWIFIFDSPRTFINKRDFKTSLKILEGIASFNGKLNEFRESIQEEEFQDFIMFNSIVGNKTMHETNLQTHIYNDNIDNDNNDKKNDDNIDNNNGEKKDNEENEEKKDNVNNNGKNEGNEENKENKGNDDIVKINIDTEQNRNSEENKIRVSDRDTQQKSISDKENNLNSNKSNTKDNTKDYLNEPFISRRTSKIQDINIWSLFKYPSIRYKFLILTILWIGTKIVFNGISISSKSFRGNFYINIIILSIMEAISYSISGFIIDIKEIGRKGALWIQYLLIIISLLLILFIKLDVTPELILNLVTRFSVAGIHVVYFTYTIEVYPTLVRSVAFGINLTFGNCGSIMTPVILEYLNNWLFLTVLIALCAMDSLLIIFLPETVGKPMIESIAELGD